MFLIRDVSGAVFNEIKNPAAVYDGKLSVLLKIGELEEMGQYFNLVQNLYRNHGFNDIADDIYIMELPKNQEEIDKVFQICDYIGKLHKTALN